MSLEDIKACNILFINLFFNKFHQTYSVDASVLSSTKQVVGILIHDDKEIRSNLVTGTFPVAAHGQTFISKKRRLVLRSLAG